MYMEAGRQSNAREGGDGRFGAWAGAGLAKLRLCLAFVDSEAGFGYSGVLARCCAWGLCVLTRTRLVNPFERGFTGTGHRLLDAGFGRVQQSQSPSGASPRSPHPNRFVWKWVESRPVHFARAQALCAAVLLRRLAPVVAGQACGPFLPAMAELSGLRMAGKTGLPAVRGGAVCLRVNCRESIKSGAFGVPVAFEAKRGNLLRSGGIVCLQQAMTLHASFISRRQCGQDCLRCMADAALQADWL